jgi:hypothetical protein
VYILIVHQVNILKETIELVIIKLNLRRP